MNDVAGMIEDVEEIAILVPQIPTRMVERAADVPQISTDQQTVPGPRKSPHRTSIDLIRCLSSDSGSSSAAGHDPRGIQASSSASDDPLMWLCPLQCCRPRRESRRCSATDRGKCTVPAPSAMMQEVVYEVDREEEVSQSDADPVKKATISEDSTLQSAVQT